jgi:hypothetical protein
MQNANCKLQTANCKLQTANCKLRTANYTPPVTRHPSRFSSRVTRHVSPTLLSTTVMIPLFFLTFVMMNLIHQHIDQIRRICFDHKVEQLFVFGSIKTDRFNDRSDVDVLIQFSSLVNPLEYFDNYMEFKGKLESLLSREIDIVENQAVRNPIFRKILDREKILIYERKSA